MKKIKLTKEEDYRKALVIFHELGGYPMDNGHTIDSFMKYFPYDYLPEKIGFVGVTSFGNVTGWSSRGNFIADSVSIDDSEGIKEFIVELLKNKSSTTIKIGDYEAIVSDKEIQVGCQKISFEKFDEIVNAVNQQRNK